MHPKSETLLGCIFLIEIRKKDGAYSTECPMMVTADMRERYWKNEEIE